MRENKIQTMSDMNDIKKNVLTVMTERMSQYCPDYIIEEKVVL